jgi:hypothetical protein
MFHSMDCGLAFLDGNFILGLPEKFRKLRKDISHENPLIFPWTRTALCGAAGIVRESQSTHQSIGFDIASDGPRILVGIAGV